MPKEAKKQQNPSRVYKGIFPMFIMITKVFIQKKSRLQRYLSNFCLFYSGIYPVSIRFKGIFPAFTKVCFQGILPLNSTVPGSARFFKPLTYF